MDILLLPSYREGISNVVLEASSAGRPTMGFRSTRVRDVIVDGETGRKWGTGDAGALVEPIGGYLAAPEVAERHGAAARVRIARAP